MRLSLSIVNNTKQVSTPETPLSWSLPFVIAAGALVTGGFLAGQPSSRSTTTERYTARYVVNAAGMASDKVSAMAGAPDFEIHKRCVALL